jgi:hypothetical protein
MLRWLGRFRLRFWLSHSSVETSRLIVGSTGSGKSEGELVDLVRLADRREYAVVLLDSHGPLAFRAAGLWGAHGHEPRMVYEPLDATDRVLCWHMLPRSTAPGLSQRLIEDAETRDDVAQCFLAQRNLGTLNDKPWTKEWLEAAIDLCLFQPRPEPLGSMVGAFRVGSADYERLLTDCTQADLAAKFRGMERLKRKNDVQYEIQTGASRRLVELVCDSEVVRLRSRPGPFDWLEALREKKLVAFDGGGLRSKELKRTLFLLASMQVIHAVRRHFAATQRSLPVVLVLEEAGALGLVTPFVLTALQELRKAGLSVHVITQSSVDFGDRDLFEAILANTPWQAWYQVLSPADQELGAKALTNATFDPLTVHYTRTRPFPDGVERVDTVSRGETFDPQSHTVVRRDRRTGMALRTRYRHVIDPSYKTPQLWEQEYRTQLATLRIGERLVRDRDGVRRERVRPVRAPWLRRITDASTRALIEHLRRQPIYQPSSPLPDPARTVKPLPDAAERLRGRVRREDGRVIRGLDIPAP